MNEGKLRKVGVVKAPDGKYTDKNGAEKTRFHEIGIVFATPHFSTMRIKLHSNGFGEGQFCSVFWDDDNTKNEAGVAPSENSPQGNYDSNQSKEIPF